MGEQASKAAVTICVSLGNFIISKLRSPICEIKSISIQFKPDIKIKKGNTLYFIFLNDFLLHYKSVNCDSLEERDSRQMSALPTLDDSSASKSIALTSKLEIL